MQFNPQALLGLGCLCIEREGERDWGNDRRALDRKSLRVYLLRQRSSIKSISNLVED